jgi:hypothetical protein
MPGKRHRASLKVVMGSGNGTQLHHSGQIETLRGFAHFRVGNFLGLDAARR